MVVEKVTTKKGFKSQKVAHVWTGETRFQVALRVQGKTFVVIPAQLIVLAGDLAPVAIADSGASRVILTSTALNMNSKEDCDLTPGSSD